MPRHGVIFGICAGLFVLANSACDSGKSTPPKAEPNSANKASPAPETDKPAKSSPASTKSRPMPPDSGLSTPDAGEKAAEKESSADLVRYAGYEFAVPKGWVVETPSSQMRMAQFS